MPNISGDGFIEEGQFVSGVSSTPVSLDYQLQAAVAAAINTQAILGAGTAKSTTVSVASYTAANANDATQKNDLINRIMQRLTNLGYGSSLSGTTLTITWP
jgi:hypothetical protein